MKIALITGGAKRVGAGIVEGLHQEFDVLIHYHNSKSAAVKLCAKLNAKRAGSARIMEAKLDDLAELQKLAEQIPQLDLLVNNAAVFYPTSVLDASENDWQKIISINLFAPFFLSQSLLPQLKKSRGCIVNIVDIHCERPLKNHAIYNISKSGLAALTKTLAKELAPDIRVCGVSPGLILWPSKISETQKTAILNKIPLKKSGNTSDIAKAVLFLANSPYATGQIINIDGGRTLNQ